MIQRFVNNNKHQINQTIVATLNNKIILNVIFVNENITYLLFVISADLAVVLRRNLVVVRTGF